MVIWSRLWERFLLVAMVALIVATMASTAAAIVETGHRNSASASDATPAELAANQLLYPIVFPVVGDFSYTDSWGAPRSGGRTHKGADIFADKGTPVVAAADGKVVKVTTGVRAGRYIELSHDGGWHTLYLHLNNDSEGTDDGAVRSPVTDIEVGDIVAAGTVIDHVGDSGNAEETPAHLHFEIHDASGSAVDPYPSLRAAEGKPLLTPPIVAAAAPAYAADDVAFLGHYPTSLGFNADVTVHGGVAYLSTWGRPNLCPASGVRMIDVSDPRAPTELASIATGDEFPETSTDSVWVGHVATEAFTGDLAVVAIRLCDTSERNRRDTGLRGLALYEVTDASSPELLGTFESGTNTQGVHELDVTVRPDGRVVAAATVLQSLRHSGGEAGDVRIVDLTDPTAPTELANWDLRRDGPPDQVAEMLAQVHDDLELHAHSATWAEDGYQLWVANWDAGAVLLDTTDPSAPDFVSVAGFDPDSDGNAHSLAIDADAGILLRVDQDLINADVGRHSRGWGNVHIYDVSNPNKIGNLSTFDTAHSAPPADGDTDLGDGRYSAHVAQIADGLAYVAWYSDGMRVIDLSDPTAPVEIASFVPPPGIDPQGYWEAPNGTRAIPMVWGVHVEADTIYISDMNTGLWIVRYPIPVPPKEAHGAE